MTNSGSKAKTREVLWEKRLDAKLNACVSKKLKWHYTKWDRRAKLLIAVTSSGTVASWAIWSAVQPLWQTLSGVAAVVAIITVVYTFEKKVAALGDITGRWIRSAQSWEQL